MAAAIGNIMPNVPQLVPVEKAMIAAKIKSSAGNKANGNVSETRDAKYAPVCTSLTTLLIVHAKNKIKIAPSMDFMPSNQPLIYS